MNKHEIDNQSIEDLPVDKAQLDEVNGGSANGFTGVVARYSGTGDSNY